MTYRDAPAFPESKVYAYRCTDEKHQGDWTPPMTVGHGGLTKREYFAAQVAQGLSHELIKWSACGHDFVIDYQTHATTAVQMADALIAALAAEPPDDAA